MNILIVEKQTSYEYLNTHQELEGIDQEVLKLLEQKHEKHYELREKITSFLESKNVEFKFIKDFEIKKDLYEDIDLLITLGGDGVFLHGVKHLNQQPVIGINSDVSSSVGFLTKHTEDTMLTAIESAIKGTSKIEHWDRLSAKINGKTSEYTALNEVVVSVPVMYKTSHVTVSHNGKSVKSRGNGVIVATNKGSYAFYNSAGGTPFSTPGMGYVTILPYSLSGDLSYAQQVLTRDQTITIIPNRQHHTLIFDCDEERKVNLGQEDKVDIFIDSTKALHVVI